MQDRSELPSTLLVFIALIQGLALVLLHQAIEHKFWPNDAPHLLFSFYSIAFVGPTMLLLVLETNKILAALKWIVPFTLLTALLGFYVGSQAVPKTHIRFDSLLFAYVLTMSIAVFKALMYIQQKLDGGEFSYGALFSWSWRNFLTLALSLLFSLCVWGVLMLCAGLFKAINIDFFYDLFTEAWFYYPALALANGFGIIIFRRMTHVIDTITRLQQALAKFLLVALISVASLFLIALLGSGLTPLWESGGSHLVLWLQAIILFSVNSVYQSETESLPYNTWLHRFIYVGVAIMPIYSAISYYGLSLRVDQYGWSVMRCWAFIIWVILALFSCGYLFGILRLRDAWIKILGTTNVLLGLVVLVSMLLVNSPLLDFRKVVVASQVARLEDKKVTADDFDIYYFRRHLARPGYLALQSIKETYAESAPNLANRISSLYADPNAKEEAFSKEDFIASVEVLSGELPDSLGEYLYGHVSGSTWDAQNVKQRFLAELDLNTDGEKEYMLFYRGTYGNYLKFYYWEAGAWHETNIRQISTYKDLNEKFLEELRAGNIELFEPRWKNLRIGEYEIEVEN